MSSPSGNFADVLEPVLTLLSRYVSRLTARSIVSGAARRKGTTLERLDRTQLQELLEAIDSGLKLFLADPQRAAECSAALAALAGAGPKPQRPTSLVLAVRAEEDIARVRADARDFAAAHGFSPTGQTRLSTAVSELVRNIVLYAGSGELELKAATQPAGLEVVARDKGPGIPNLEQILAGNYRSKLGMGLGLRGVKRLATRFAVQTAAGRGTTVTFVMEAV